MPIHKLATLYSRHTEAATVIKAAGGLKKFCVTHGRALGYDDRNPKRIVIFSNLGGGGIGVGGSSPATASQSTAAFTLAPAQPAAGSRNYNPQAFGGGPAGAFSASATPFVAVAPPTVRGMHPGATAAAAPYGTAGYGSGGGYAAGGNFGGYAGYGNGAGGGAYAGGGGGGYVGGFAGGGAGGPARKAAPAARGRGGRGGGAGGFAAPHAAVRVEAAAACGVPYLELLGHHPAADGDADAGAVNGAV
jgi:hypothetical protein